MTIQDRTKSVVYSATQRAHSATRNSLLSTPHSPFVIECINRQRSFRLPRTIQASLQKLAFDVLSALGVAEAEVSIVIVSDEKIRRLNREYRQQDKPTDVLSFPYHGANEAPPHCVVHGDVVISIQAALKQAKKHALTLRGEIEMLALHGVLHLCGFDHETDQGEMSRLERRLRRKLLPPPR